MSVLFLRCKMPQTSSLPQTYQLQNSITKQTIEEFQKSIHKNRFFNNREYLFYNSTLIKFNKKNWFLRPEYFCAEYYGIPELFRVILLLNNISSRFNFRAENLKKGILTPTLESIRDVLTQNIR